MSNDYLVLVINPGATSTKIAVYKNKYVIFSETVEHNNNELLNYKNIIDQFELRYKNVLESLENNNIKINNLHAVIGRGGLLKPIESGTYYINQKMLDELSNSHFRQHASNLGAIIAHKIATINNVPSYIADPVVVDEMIDEARITGRPEIMRESRFHALNHKAVGRKVADILRKNYEDINIIVAHMGGGTSVGVHVKGRVQDVTEALYGDAPFSVERAGKLPTGPLIEMCFEEGAKIEDIKKKLVGEGGLKAHFGTNDARIIEDKIKSGEENYTIVYKSMAYQISKEIASFSATANGDIDAIVLTGGLARSKILTEWITERVKFLANVYIFPGEFEMEALAHCAYKVLTGIENAKEYS